MDGEKQSTIIEHIFFVLPPHCAILEKVMTRIEAEEIFTTCSAIVEVMGGDLRRLCLSRGIPEEYLEEFIQRNSRKEDYDRFFEVHDRGGEINLTEEEIVAKLGNFGYKISVEEEDKKYIEVPAGKYPNSVELHLCKVLTTKYDYSYR